MARLARMRIGVTLPLSDGDTADGHVPDVRRRRWPSARARGGGRARLDLGLRPPAVPLRGQARRGPSRGLDDARGTRSGRPAGGAGRARHVLVVPQPGTHGQDGRDARRPVRRAGDPRPRVRLARPRVRGLRLPDRSPGRAVRGGPRDHGPPPARRTGERPRDGGGPSPTPCSSRHRRGPSRSSSPRRASGCSRLTATWADAWNTAWFGRVDDRLRTRMAGLDAACAAVGPGSGDGPPDDRDPAPRSGHRRRRRVRAGCRPPRAWPTSSTSSRPSAWTTALIWSISKSPAALDRIAQARMVHLARTP